MPGPMALSGQLLNKISGMTPDHSSALIRVGSDRQILRSSASWKIVLTDGVDHCVIKLVVGTIEVVKHQVRVKMVDHYAKKLDVDAAISECSYKIP